MRLAIFLSAAVVCLSTCGQAGAAASDAKNPMTSDVTSSVLAGHNLVVDDVNTEQQRFLRRLKAEDFGSTTPEKMGMGKLGYETPLSDGSQPATKNAQVNAGDDSSDSSSSDSSVSFARKVVDRSTRFLNRDDYDSWMRDDHKSKADVEEYLLDRGMWFPIFRPIKYAQLKGYVKFLRKECRLSKNKDEPACA